MRFRRFEIHGFLFIVSLLLLASCSKDSCTNGVRDQGEEQVDCGGACPDVCPTCEDGIQNGDETGIDCGGSQCSQCYKIGDIGKGGGIVFYDKANCDNGWRYIEAAPIDQHEALNWGCKGLFVGNTSRKVGFAINNSKEIDKSCTVSVFNPKYHWALHACWSYKLDNKWYLPTKDELNLMYENKNIIGEFRDSPYWSSSEERADDAWLQEFSNGDQYCEFKDRKIRVRAIRYF